MIGSTIRNYINSLPQKIIRFCPKVPSLKIRELGLKGLAVPQSAILLLCLFFSLPALAEKSVAECTGFFINPTQIMTAAHCVENTSQQLVFIQEDKTSPHQAFVLAYDRNRDLAILVVVGIKNHSFLPIATKEPKSGNVISIGFPMPDFHGYKTNFEWGTINSLSLKEDTFDMIIHPGDSGGPILDRSGQVISVMQAALVEEGMSGGAIVLGISTPALLNFLITNQIAYTSAKDTEEIDFYHLFEMINQDIVFLVSVEN